MNTLLNSSNTSTTIISDATNLNSSNQLSLSKIAHELSNPLTLLYGSIQLLSDKYPELSKDDLWTQLNEDVTYLNQLVAALPKKAANSDLHIQTVPVQQLFDDLNAYWQSYASHHHRHLIFDLDKNTGVIECDPIKIKQCLMNLIKNSFEATGKNATIHVHAHTENQMLILKVSDTGTGILDEHIQHIFEPATTYKSGGKGLGLTITQEIIEAHHGSISVESTYSGTHFIIRLPMIQPK